MTTITPERSETTWSSPTVLVVTRYVWLASPEELNRASGWGTRRFELNGLALVAKLSQAPYVRPDSPLPLACFDQVALVSGAALKLMIPQGWLYPGNHSEECCVTETNPFDQEPIHAAAVRYYCPPGHRVAERFGGCVWFQLTHTELGPHVSAQLSWHMLVRAFELFRFSRRR